MIPSPSDLFFEWLSERPTASRMAIAVDGDRLLADAGLLGKEKLADTTGRTWRLVVFRGDDIAFRKSYRNAREAEHVLIVLARSTATASRINVSYVSDILSANEGGPPFDASVPAVFRRLCPHINFPIAELRQFKDVLLAHIERVPEATKKIVERWGRPDDWGRAQVAALALLVRHPDWALAEIWPDELEPGASIAHALRVLLSVPPESTDLRILQQLLPDAVQLPVKPYLFWLAQPLDQLAAYLVIRKFAADTALQNPVVQLTGLQVFPLEFPLDKLEPLASRVISSLQVHAKGWRAIQGSAEEFITPKRAARLSALIGGHSHNTDLAVLSSPALLLPFLERRLAEYFANPVRNSLSWVSELQSNPALESNDGNVSERQIRCQTLVRLATRIQHLEQCIAQPIPKFSHAEQLLDWHIHTGHHLLELEAARALHDQHDAQDEELAHAALKYLLESDDEQAPAAGSLMSRVRSRLEELDHILADLIVADPQAFSTGPRSFVSFIKGVLQDEVQPILTGESDKRVWVLIFDGMRYDTWVSVVQPLLGGDFLVSGNARFCTLPSYTLYARRSVLAGSSPAEWATGKRAASRSEESLFAENLGLAKHEVKEKLRLLTDAETTKARTKLNYKDTSTKPFNVLIYPISDDCHDYRGDLASFNERIRLHIVGNRESGVRGIRDDLLRRVKPGDIVLVTSDHGFIELDPPRAVTVADKDATSHQAELSNSVFFRYAKSFTPANLEHSVSIEAGGELHALCVGRTWLKREAQGQTSRYSHGGVSLAELVIPAVRMERVAGKVTAFEFVSLPESIGVDEDDTIEVAFSVKNKGNTEAKLMVTARTNLDEELLRFTGELPPSGSHPLKLEVTGTYRTRPNGDIDARNTLSAINVRLRFSDQSGQWHDAVDGISNITVKVHAKKTKLATDALSGFDDV